MDKFIHILRTKPDGSACPGVLNVTLHPKIEGETDQEWFSRIKDAGEYITVGEVEKHEMLDLSADKSDVQGKKLIVNPEKEKQSFNKVIDINIKEIENGFPRPFRDLVLANQSILDPIGVKKVQDAENSIQTLRAKRIK